MPQINKDGKFIFGKSIIKNDGCIKLLPQAIEEYDMCSEGKVYLCTGCKSTSGFCITRKGLLKLSKLAHIPQLDNYPAENGEFIAYKDHYYCWTNISKGGQLFLSKSMMNFLKIKSTMQLLSIRSSDIAFTMGAKCLLMEKSEQYEEKFLYISMRV